MFEQLFDDLSAKAEANSRQVDGDYIQDGLLHCGVCHTAKQCRVDIFGQVRIVGCICKCVQEQLAREEQAKKERERRKRIEEMRKIGFEEEELKYWTFANDDMEKPKLSKAMRTYADNFDNFYKSGKGLLLYGSVGTGKTYFSACIANEVLEDGYSVLMTNFSRILNVVTGTLDRQAYIDKINRFDLVVFDDLGVERNTEFAREIVYSVIDARYRSGKPMIITTNLSMEEMKKPQDLERLRIYDRILERCHPIEVAGASKRRGKIRNEFNEMQELLGLTE